MARINLASRPALKNGPTAVEWFGPGDWARSTSMHASLPRSTGYAGTTPGDIQMTRGAAIPGKWYVWSASCRFVSPQVVQTKTNWYTSGNVYLTTTDGPVWDQAGSTTRRIVSGVGQAPADTVDVRPVIDSIDGSLQVTAVLIEQYDTEAEANAALAAHQTAAYYFDGDGDGVGTSGAAWSWNGTNGESPSTSTAGAVPTGSITFGAVTMAGLGVRTSTGTGSITFGAVSIATDMIASATYDPRRGRVRVDAIGLPASVVRAVVYSRPEGRSRWTEVRGGRVTINASEHRLARKVDDYEFVAGARMQYRVVALSSAEGQPDAIVAQRIVDAGRVAGGEVWLKFIAAPASNRKVILHDWSEIAHEARNVLHQVRGREDPIAVTDVHTAATMTVELITETRAEREALRTALRQGAPVFFQTPDTVECPSMYAVVGSFTVARLAPKSVRSLFVLPLTEVAPPPPSVVGVAVTWASLTQRYASWAELLTDPDLDTWRDVSS